VATGVLYAWNDVRLAIENRLTDRSPLLSWNEFFKGYARKGTWRDGSEDYNRPVVHARPMAAEGVFGLSGFF
jgi:hypothetical protein